MNANRNHYSRAARHSTLTQPATARHYLTAAALLALLAVVL